MKEGSLLVSLKIVLGFSLLLYGQQETVPVRMGSGEMTFETVPGWGLGDDGKSILGSTHGSVVIDNSGNIYTSSKKGVTVFSPSGEVIRSYWTKDHSDIHDMEIRQEDDQEFIYGARDANAEGIKFRAIDGRIILRFSFPPKSGLTGENFSPTALTVAPTGDDYLSDGYGSNVIFIYDREGK